MEKLNELVALANFTEVSPNGFDKGKMIAVMPEKILAIAEAFRALEKRAEAVEARANNLNDGWLNAITERDEARSKLAELEKQDPYGYANPKAIERMLNGDTRFYTVKPERSVINRLPVFINPAPAADLAALVPDRKPVPEPGECLDSTSHWCDGWNACRAAILRNIEEAK